MNDTIEFRCPKRHLLASVTKQGDRYLLQPHEVLTTARKSADGEWYGVGGNAKPTTGVPSYDLQEEAEDGWQVQVKCKCGRRSVPAAWIYDQVIAGESAPLVDAPLMP